MSWSVRRHRACLLAFAVATSFAIAGCSAAPSATQPSPSVSVVTTAPTGGVTLRGLGVKNGPEGFSVPAGLSNPRIIDQPNVVTLTYRPQDAVNVEQYLSANLASMGFTITNSGGGSLLFTSPTWKGAFTSSDELAGLTLRRL